MHAQGQLAFAHDHAIQSYIVKTLLRVCKEIAACNIMPAPGIDKVNCSVARQRDTPSGSVYRYCCCGTLDLHWQLTHSKELFLLRLRSQLRLQGTNKAALVPQTLSLATAMACVSSFSIMLVNKRMTIYLL